MPSFEKITHLLLLLYYNFSYLSSDSITYIHISRSSLKMILNVSLQLIQQYIHKTEFHNLDSSFLCNLDYPGFPGYLSFISPYHLYHLFIIPLKYSAFFQLFGFVHILPLSLLASLHWDILSINPTHWNAFFSSRFYLLYEEFFGHSN